jgi:hypothetical protein
MLALQALHERTRGSDIFSAFENMRFAKNVPSFYEKLASRTTAMTGKFKEFTALLKIHSAL